MEFKDVFSPPFTNYEFGTMVFDSRDRISLTIVANFSDPALKTILGKLNGENKKKPRTGRFHIDNKDPCKILFDNKTIALVRGWGRLTGRGGLNLDGSEAARLQDDFAKWIVETLNK